MKSLVYNQQFNNQKVRENNVTINNLTIKKFAKITLIPTSLLEDYSLDILQYFTNKDFLGNSCTSNVLVSNDIL